MKKSNWILAAMVVGIVVPWQARGHAAQNQPEPSAMQEPAAEVIPPDQQASLDQLAKLFQAMRLRDQFESLVKMIPNATQQQLKKQMNQLYSNLPPGQQPTPQQQADLEKLTDKYMQKALNVYPIDEMLKDVATIYQRHLSRVDVEAMTAFYNSPAGQHFIAAQPVISKEFMPIVMQRVQKATADLSNEMIKEAQEYIKTSAPPAGAPSH